MASKVVKAKGHFRLQADINQARRQFDAVFRQTVQLSAITRRYRLPSIQMSLRSNIDTDVNGKTNRMVASRDVSVNTGSRELSHVSNAYDIVNTDVS